MFIKCNFPDAFHASYCYSSMTTQEEETEVNTSYDEQVHRQMK